MTALHLYLDDQPLGDYLATLRVTVWDRGARFSDVCEGTITLDELVVLRLHVDNAIHALEQRRLDDVLAGWCDLCSNVRMITTTKHGQKWTEHCPVCRPKIDAGREAVNGGLSARDEVKS